MAPCLTADNQFLSTPFGTFIQRPHNEALSCTKESISNIKRTEHAFTALDQ